MKVGELGFELKTFIGLLVLLAITPIFAGNYYTRLLTVGMLLGLAALGFNVLYGYTGLLSFGHAMFWGIGAYGVAIATVKMGLGLPEGFMLSIGLVVGLALLTGYISLRHTKIYFAMLTLAFSQLLYAIVLKWRDVTGADEGLYGIPTPILDIRGYYYMVLALSVALVFLTWWVLETPMGLSFRSIRDNAYRAEVIGIPVRRVRLISFVISGFVTGVAGSFYAPLQGAITPDIIYWTFSAQIVFIAILGGSRSLIGPFIGGIIYVFLKDEAMSLTQYWMLLFGFLLAVMVYVLPTGIFGLISSVVKSGGKAGPES